MNKIDPSPSSAVHISLTPAGGAGGGAIEGGGGSAPQVLGMLKYCPRPPSNAPVWKKENSARNVKFPIVYTQWHENKKLKHPQIIIKTQIIIKNIPPANPYIENMVLGPSPKRLE